jgi:hypothetical protein
LFRSLFWRGLAIAVVYMLLAVISFPSSLPLHTVFAQAATTPDVTVERVWTRDGNGHDKTSFIDGDDIQYTVLLNNTSNTTVIATFVFKATGPHQIYFWKGNAPVAPGISGYYSPAAIPANAPPGTYTIHVTVTAHDQSSTNTSSFTVLPTHATRSKKGYFR